MGHDRAKTLSELQLLQSGSLIQREQVANYSHFVLRVLTKSEQKSDKRMFYYSAGSEIYQSKT